MMHRQNKHPGTQGALRESLGIMLIRKVNNFNNM